MQELHKRRGKPRKKNLLWKIYYHYQQLISTHNNLLWRKSYDTKVLFHLYPDPVNRKPLFFFKIGLKQENLSKIIEMTFFAVDKPPNIHLGRIHAKSQHTDIADQEIINPTFGNKPYTFLLGYLMFPSFILILLSLDFALFLIS